MDSDQQLQTVPTKQSKFQDFTQSGQVLAGSVTSL